MRRFVYPVNITSSSPSDKVESLSFDDYDEIVSVAWVGKSDSNLDVEFRTHNGKKPIVDLVPIEFLKLGSDRAELELNQHIENNQIKIKFSHSGGVVKGSFVFTMEK